MGKRENLWEDYEIVQTYKNAKHKKKQICILAQLNGCTVKYILKVLYKNGAITKEQIAGMQTQKPIVTGQPKKKPSVNRPTPFNDGRAYKYYKIGMTDREIAERIGCTRGRVQRWRKMCGLKSNDYESHRPDYLFPDKLKNEV